ncbi:DNA-methyltransferase [Paraburkholderia sp. SIMBA_030]|uniref:DNA-methyltransferase n=1 Tax=Paraburkholderia sp. SIMBA_030 TaxID=3085773 RepID=UPI003978481F
MTKIPVYRSTKTCIQGSATRQASLFCGDALELAGSMSPETVDVIFSSPPYCIGKEYESARSVEDFRSMHSELLPELIRSLRPGGSFCWQVGSHVKNGVVTPLDYIVFAEMARFPEMRLRNRVIWSFGHGLHCANRFSGRHEVVLWFTKGDDYYFDLDSVRVPQKYPGKTHTRGPRKGTPSGNPRGKNPGDVWDVPNVKANHVEKTEHPCQFPVALPQVFIRALTKPGDLVFDPFCGSGTTGVAALLEGRRFVGSEIDASYVAIAKERMADACDGTAAVRPWDKAIHVPNKSSKVARPPEEFITVQGLVCHPQSGLGMV